MQSLHNGGIVFFIIFGENNLIMAAVNIRTNLATNPVGTPEMITVATSVVSLVDDGTIPANATMATVQAQGGDVRFWLDGTNPSATVGRLLYDGNELPLLTRYQLNKIKMIRDTGTSSTTKVAVQYYL